MNNLDNIGNLFAYALGFACGSYIGIFIESKIGLGNLSVQVILKHDDDEELINKLREHGYAVTKLTAYGREGTKDLEELKKVIAE